jgi:hypothetical protein
MTTVPAHVLESLPEEDAALLARFEDDYNSSKSRRRCSRRDFMDGYLAAARRFARPMPQPRTRVSRTERQQVAKRLSLVTP